MHETVRESRVLQAIAELEAQDETEFDVIEYRRPV